MKLLEGVLVKQYAIPWSGGHAQVGLTSFLQCPSRAALVKSSTVSFAAWRPLVLTGKFLMVLFDK